MKTLIRDTTYIADNDVIRHFQPTGCAKPLLRIFINLYREKKNGTKLYDINVGLAGSAFANPFRTIVLARVEAKNMDEAEQMANDLLGLND